MLCLDICTKMFQNGKSNAQKGNSCYFQAYFIKRAFDLKLRTIWSSSLWVTVLLFIFKNDKRILKPFFINANQIVHLSVNYIYNNKISLIKLLFFLCLVEKFETQWAVFCYFQEKYIFWALSLNENLLYDPWLIVGNNQFA